jgi:putative NIF3 family GTP cyclohydrolase 1 type 2
VGTGIIADTDEPVDVKEFLLKVKQTFGVERMMHSVLNGQKINRVALCGGAGASFAGNAQAAGADIYITGEGHYHDMFNYSDKMVVAAIGHYESEQYTTEIFAEILSERFPDLAVMTTTKRTNPVYYL